MNSEWNLKRGSRLPCHIMWVNGHFLLPLGGFHLDHQFHPPETLDHYHHDTKWGEITGVEIWGTNHFRGQCPWLLTVDIGALLGQVLNQIPLIKIILFYMNWLTRAVISRKISPFFTLGNMVWLLHGITPMCLSRLKKTRANTLGTAVLTLINHMDVFLRLVMGYYFAWGYTNLYIGQNNNCLWVGISLNKMVSY